MDIEKVKDKAAMFLEEMNVSGDAMIDMDHCLDELPEEKQGAYYLHDLMAFFLKQRLESDQHETIVMQPEITPGTWKVRYMAGEDDGECDMFVQAESKKLPYGIEILQEDFGDHADYPRNQKLADAKAISALPDILQASTIILGKLISETGSVNAFEMLNLKEALEKAGCKVV